MYVYIYIVSSLPKFSEIRYIDIKELARLDTERCPQREAAIF